MLKGIDHIVIAVTDLEKAARDYSRLGFTVIPGGRHPVGTHNALISFADGSYIEIISFYRESPDHRWWQPLQKGEGLVDFCMQTDDLTGDTQRLRDAGIDIKDPVPWARTRPDGYELKWLLSLVRGGHRGIAPFLIQDITPREERIPQKFEHENGATGIGTLTVAVGELAKVGEWYKNVVEKEPETITDETVAGKGVRFDVGPHRLAFLSPADPQSPLANWLTTVGPSPYAATVRRKSPNLFTLDSQLTHGANLSFE
jgi:catechol 2,3-dioxygenase-like lactoylglutathione lyase family enzyme